MYRIGYRFHNILYNRWLPDVLKIYKYIKIVITYPFQFFLWKKLKQPGFGIGWCYVVWYCTKWLEVVLVLKLYYDQKNNYFFFGFQNYVN